MTGVYSHDATEIENLFKALPEKEKATRVTRGHHVSAGESLPSVPLAGSHVPLS